MGLDFYVYRSLYRLQKEDLLQRLYIEKLSAEASREAMSTNFAGPVNLIEM